MSNDNKEQKDKILQMVLDAIQQDQELREKFQVGDKFRFIRDRLNALKQRVEEALNAIQQEIEKKTDQLAEDEVLVYVYIFNAQGLVFQTWQKMLTPSVFYEYSVNRPIYADKNFVEAFIRSRPSKAQHGFLTIAIKKSDVIPPPAGTEQQKDQVGNPLIKIREGSLRLNRLFSFTHQGNEYTVNEAGQVVRKE
jgi:hypothetical protein